MDSWHKIEVKLSKSQVAVARVEFFWPALIEHVLQMSVNPELF